MPEHMCPHCHAVYRERQQSCPNDGSILIEVPVLDDLSGKVLRQKYRLDETLGQGGFGAVYKATHLVLGKQVAVKVLRAEFRSDSTMVARFFNEARVVTRLTNPHTINTFDLDQAEEGFLFMVMDFVEGRTLRQLARLEGNPPGRLPWQRAVGLLIQVCEALEEAHSAGVVHRDLKPDNVMVSNRGGATDFVTVLDFGIAKVIEGTDMQNLTAAGMLLGSPAYMSPEQVKGSQLSSLSDIYSLGVIAYQVLSGLLPVNARQTAAILQEKMLTRPEPLSRKVPDLVLPLELENLVMNMLEVEEELRPQNAGEVKERFLEVLRCDGGTVPAGQGTPVAGGSTAPRNMEGTVGYDVPFRQPSEAEPVASDAEPATPGPREMTRKAKQAAVGATSSPAPDEDVTRVPAIVTGTRPANRRLLGGLAVAAVILVAVAVGLAVGIGVKTKGATDKQGTPTKQARHADAAVTAQPAGASGSDVHSMEKQPVVEKKMPVEEKKQPVEEKKQPVEEKKQPVEEKKQPVEEKKQPVEEKKQPVEEKKQPVEEKKQPVEEKKMPVEEKKIPVEEKKQPVEEKKLPVEEKKQPVEEKKLPVEEKKQPVDEEALKKEIDENIAEEMKALDDEVDPVDDDPSDDHIDEAFDELDGEDPW